MDHLQQAKFDLEQAMIVEEGADMFALNAIGHALVALVEQLKHPAIRLTGPTTTMHVLSAEERAADQHGFRSNE